MCVTCLTAARAPAPHARLTRSGPWATFAGAGGCARAAAPAGVLSLCEFVCVCVAGNAAPVSPHPRSAALTVLPLLLLPQARQRPLRPARGVHQQQRRCGVPATRGHPAASHVRVQVRTPPRFTHRA
jgi:hypothetical protein